MKIENIKKAILYMSILILFIFIYINGYIYGYNKAANSYQELVNKEMDKIDSLFNENIKLYQQLQK